MNNIDLSIKVFNKGVDEKRKGNIPEAIELYKESYKLDPRNPEPFRAIGKAHYIVGEYEDSISAYLDFLYFSVVKWIRSGQISKGSEVELNTPDLGWYSFEYQMNAVRHLGASFIALMSKKDSDFLDISYKNELNIYRLTLCGKNGNLSESFYKYCIDAGNYYISKVNWPYDNWL